MPNIRTKGQTGERDVQKIFNDIVEEVYAENGWDKLESRDLPFQRNQNQSAVGGSDLSNPFNVEIEVKRQEALSVGSWWKQCVDSAARTNGIPILIFKQNRKKWRVMLFVDIKIAPPGRALANGLNGVAAEISLEDLKIWWKAYFIDWLAFNAGR